jgi:hypothetical protein
MSSAAFKTGLLFFPTPMRLSAADSASLYRRFTRCATESKTTPTETFPRQKPKKGPALHSHRDGPACPGPTSARRLRRDHAHATSLRAMNDFILPS